jgi:demethylspheroidene O-methyltransferase
MVAHHAMFYSDLADPVGLLRGTTPPTQLSRFWGYARSGGPERLTEAQIAGYTELMSASQDLVADDILDAYPVAQHRVLLDIGGGDGTFAAHAANRAPELKIMLFDLPAVADRARARFERAGIAERATAYGGDFATGPLPEGADLITLVRVLHDHDDEKVRRILSAARQAARPGATLLVAEPVSGTKSAEPMADAYFGFYLMAMGSGRPRTLARISELVCAAGFNSPRTVPTRMPLQTSLIAAKCR